MKALYRRSGSMSVPIETRKPDTKFREAEAEAEADRKQYYEAEAEAEAIKNSI